VQRLAGFVASTDFQTISDTAREALKIRVLDTLGCAVAALASNVVIAVRDEVEEMGGNPLCTLIGGGLTAPDGAAFFNGAATRYLDFNDSYLAPGETCHPSDNLAAVLAAAEFASADGKDLLTALAVAYQVQCRLSDVAPVRARGFDHVTRGAYAAAAGVARAMGLPFDETANAIAIAGTAFNALRVSRTGALPTGRASPIPISVSPPSTRRCWPVTRSPGRSRSSRATRASWMRSPDVSRSTGLERTWRRSPRLRSSATTPSSTPSPHWRPCWELRAEHGIRG